uniref:Uncharacterized protein n=1 Tax=Anopheles minimus TaxID=112268 RepID=A0A182W6W6_9DIPT
MPIEDTDNQPQKYPSQYHSVETVNARTHRSPICKMYVLILWRCSATDVRLTLDSCTSFDLGNVYTEQFTD